MTSHSTAAIRRNALCPCGSGKRFKHCHGVHGSQSGDDANGPAPPSLDARVKRALHAHQSGRVDEAAEMYRQVLEEDPAHPIALHYLGVIDWHQDRVELGEARIRRALANRRDVPDFFNNLALLLQSQGQMEAQRLRLEAAGLSQDAVVHALRSRMHECLLEARDAYTAALAVAPDYAETHWGLAHVELLLGNDLRGWQEYEWRARIPRQESLISPRWSLPLWAGEALAGKTILVRLEQGAGDNIQFIRYAKSLAEAGASVVVQPVPALARLLASAPGIARVEPPETAPSGVDYQIPLMSLPLRALEGHLAPPDNRPYLHADPLRVEAWRGALHGAPRARIGLVWGGNPIVATDRYRSPGLRALLPLLETPSVSWISLQKEGRPGDETVMAGANGLIECGSSLTDFAETAALVSALDLVITSDTSVAHLAGALGKPVWILLCYCADMRWGLERGDSALYPSAHLFRQRLPGDWAGVVAEVACALRAGSSIESFAVVRPSTPNPTC